MRATKRSGGRRQDRPSTERLTAFLLGALRDQGIAEKTVQVVHRDSGILVSTFTNEVATCVVDGSQELRVFCKYGHRRVDPLFGHVGGVGYEAQVYRDILQHLALFSPRYYGSWSTEGENETWLAIEFLEGGMPLTKGPQPAGVLSAARMAGELHAGSAELVASGRFGRLTTYDLAYFSSWVERVLRFARPLRDRYPWLPTVGERFLERLPFIDSLPRTLVHGEFILNNVFVRGGISLGQRTEVAAVDWEYAATAFGEIDVACLLEGWSDDVQAACVKEYARARWGSTVPPGLAERLELARVFTQMHWLVGRPEWAVAEKSSRRFERLRVASERLGLL